MTKTLERFAPAAAAMLLVGGIALETLSRPRPGDAEPYHQLIRRLGEASPRSIGDWVGTDVAVPPAAVALLRPNFMVHRRYQNSRDGRLGASLLIVQCRDARDMMGHYPPVCYPAHGWTATAATPAEWQIGERRIIGMEYEFTRAMEGQSVSCVVCNLLVLPDGRFIRDMSEIYRAGGDYLRHFYGAAQVQVVLSAGYPAELRREIVNTLLAPHLSLLEALSSGGTR